jgi:hypothetical protein
MELTRAANIEPRETYLEIVTTIIKIPSATSISTVIIIINIPRAVAIPLPPRKPAKTVQICPITAAIPAMI